MPKSIAEGFRWATKAALAGNLKSKADMFRLSRLDSVPDAERINLQTAIAWLTDAAVKGSTQALEDLEMIDLQAHSCSKRSWRQRFCLVEEDSKTFLPSEGWLEARIGKMSLEELNNMTMNERGHTCLHLAASLGFERSVEELIGKGADVNVLNNYNENPLLCACRSGYFNLAATLLNNESHVVPARSGETPLHWLISCDTTLSDAICRGLLDRGADIEGIHFETETNEYEFDIYPHGTPLDWAVSRRQIGAIKALVEFGADPFNEESGWSPFIRAVSIHDVAVLELLLSSRHATPEKVTGFDLTGQSLLFHAIYCNSLYPRLILHGDNVCKAFIDTVKLLLERGCDPENTTRDGDTVLHLAAGFCDAEDINLLWDNFPQLQQYISWSCGPKGRTPLHHAIASGQIDVVRFLISVGANCDARSGQSTLLHLLAGVVDEKYALQCLKELRVQERADINAPAQHPDAEIAVTAFEMALLNGHLEVAEFLLRRGADARWAPDRDRSFLDVLIANAAWYSPAALQFYLDKAQPGFIVRKSDRKTAFHTAAAMGSLLGDTTTASGKLDMLLKAYPSLEQINSPTTKSIDSEVAGGQTPLHYAAKFGVYFAVLRLLEAGADISAKDDEGNTPLDLLHQQVNVIQLLSQPIRSNLLQDVSDTLKLLESAAAGNHLEARIVERSNLQSTRTRFSRLGFLDKDD